MRARGDCQMNSLFFHHGSIFDKMRAMKYRIFQVGFIVSIVLLHIAPFIMGKNVYNEIQAIIGSDAGDRGMKSLIVPGDLELAGKTLGTLKSRSHVIVLSGFPCCVNYSPPTETDGPPGTFAIARAAAALGHEVIVITDDCNAGEIPVSFIRILLDFVGREMGSICCIFQLSSLTSAFWFRFLIVSQLYFQLH